jgi:hypothetical protein
VKAWSFGVHSSKPVVLAWPFVYGEKQWERFGYLLADNSSVQRIEGPFHHSYQPLKVESYIDSDKPMFLPQLCKAGENT